MPLTLEEIFDSKRFEERSFRQPQWLNSGRLAFVDDYPGTDKPTAWTYDPEADRKAPLLDPRSLKLPGQDEPVKLGGVIWSPDERRLLLTANAPARFKPCGHLYLYDIETACLRQITDTDAARYHPKFSPNGGTIGLVRANDLWLIDVETIAKRRLTHDGSETLYNGRCGWVYEEELGLADGWAWSPDGKTIAFLQQDESGVPATLLPRYDQLHCEPETTRYPKPGDPNPRTRLGLLDAESGASRWVEFAEEPEERYVAAFQWIPSGDGVLVQVIPRLQNRLRIYFVGASDATATSVLSEDDSRWVDHEAKLHFAPNRDFFLWVSERGGHRHLYLYAPDGKWVKQLTSGEWDAADVVGATSGAIFFSAARPNPAHRHVYRVMKESGNPACLTESMPGWNRATLSEDGRFLIHTHSTIQQPPTTTLRRNDGTFVTTLAEHPEEMLKDVGLLPWEFLTIKTVDGDSLEARILRPPGREPGTPDRPNARTPERYPVIMYTYGGPCSQAVTDQWGGKRGLWEQYMAQQGYVMFACDNRGTGGRGRDFKKQVYLQLGKRETEDQIAAARYLQNLPFVDPERIGIWGWSYGGYMATNCMLHGADVFKSGIAVAPVTDWTLYDTIYTERYMRMHAENPHGYHDGSPVHFADKLKGRFLLIHGLMDDNVHFQHSARLAEALQNAKKPFETMFYPDKRHGIDDRHYHLYFAMTDFWRRSL